MGNKEAMERKNNDSVERLFEEDDQDKAVTAADDTGMVSAERVAVEAEIERGLEGGDEPGA